MSQSSNEMSKQFSYVTSKFTSASPIEEAIKQFESENLISYLTVSDIFWEYVGGRERGRLEAVAFRLFVNRSASANHANAIRAVLVEFEDKLANDHFNDKNWTIFDGIEELLVRIEKATPNRNETGYVARIINRTHTLIELNRDASSESSAAAGFDKHCLKRHESSSASSSATMSPLEKYRHVAVEDNDQDIYDNVDADDSSENSCVL